MKRFHVREYLLMAGELGISSGQTAVVVLLPLILMDYAPSALMVGMVIGAEGLFALVLPYAVGALSDRLSGRVAARVGRRNVFLLVSAPVMAAALAVAPFLEGFWPVAVAAFAFFAGFHTYRTPLETLMVDSVGEERWGSVQGVRGAFHAAGLGYGLVAGGLLFALWQPLPFLVAGALILVTTAVTNRATPRDSRERSPDPDRRRGRDGALMGVLRELRRRSDLRWLLAANALWTGSVDGIRPFVFLFTLTVLGVRIAEASLILLVLFAGVGLGSVTAGRLGDRFGRGRVLMAGAVLAGVAMGFGFFVRDVPLAVAVLIPAGLGASTFIALPLPLFVDTAGDFARGQHTGLYNLSVGTGRLAAPLVVGFAIDYGVRIFPELGGFPLMWPVAAALALLGAAALWRASVR